MIVGRDRLMDWVDLNKNPHWKLKNQDATALIAESDPAVDDFTTSRTRLSNMLDSLGNGRFFLETRNLFDQKKNILKTSFELPTTDVSVGTHNSAATQDIPTLVAAAVATQMADFKKDLTIKDLRAELRDMKLGGVGAADRIMMRLEPAIPAIVGKMFDVEVPPISGTNGTSSPSVSGHTANPKAKEAFDAQMTAFEDGKLLESEGGAKITDKETARAMAFGAARKVDPKFEENPTEDASIDEAAAADLTSALETLRDAEGDQEFLVMMQGLAKMAKEDPEKFKIAKAML